MKNVIVRLAAMSAATAAAVTGVALTSGPATAQGSLRAAPVCGNGALAVTRTFVQGAAGHSGLALIYRNETTRACSVTGYPGVDAVTTSGHVLVHAARDRSHRPGAVTIKPGHFASATLRWLNFTGSTGAACRTSAAINTIVANTTRTHRLPVAVSRCELKVGPTVAGVPGYPHYARAQFDWISIASVDAQGRSIDAREVAAELKAARVYPTQYAQAHQIASFPTTGLTGKQLKQARADVKSLDAFFATNAV